ncbi:MAG: FG-GAP-like repeat-containing protein [Terracidiphilus sp.]
MATLLVAAWNIGQTQQTLQVLHDHLRPAVSGGQAALVGPMPSDQRLNLSIVLSLRNQTELTSLLGRLYDPSSPDYRRFLSVAQFTEEFGPSVEDYQTVVSFAQANGFVVTGTPANRLVVPISGTVAQINKAFGVSMNLYQHPTENRTFYSPDREPSLSLNVPVAHITGLNNFSIPQPMLLRPQEAEPIANVTGSGPGGSYLGSDMRAAYYGGTTLNGNGQSVGLLEFDGYDLSDVNLSFSNAGQSYSVAINNVLLDGATGEPTGPEGDAEQVLDIVQAIGMAPELSQVRVYIGIGEDDADILNSMAAENIAKQLSCSWAWNPDDPSTDDIFFQEFAAQGQSFFSASGDDGAFDAAISPFFYPQEDAYVTAVGGTHLTTNGAGGEWVSEIAWNSYGGGSGGGISPDGISIPSWQAGVANSSNGGSTTLRNVPDVAMEGDFDNFFCNMGTCAGDAAGTSFAAPRWAGFMALINQQAAEAGTAPLGGIGFINPAIYPIGEGASYSNDFHDITSGNDETANQPVWYSAVTGYDLVTGWGSANGQDLINDLAGPQVPGFWIQASSGTVLLGLGASSTTTITVTDAGGFTGNVNLALTTALPSGVTASWGTNPTSGSSVLTLTSSSSATAGTTTLTITGTSGSLTATTNIIVSVHAPDFVLSDSPSLLSVNQGSSGTTTITVTPQYGFTGSVNLAVTSTLPSGVTASWGTNPTSGSSVLTLAANSSATPGTTPLTITGTAGSLTATTTVTLVVFGPSFTLVSQGSLNIGQGSSGTAFVLVLPQDGFTGSVNLAVSGLPSGVTASFSPNPTTETSFLTLAASSAASVGTSTITVTGTSGALSATTTISLGIYAPTFTLSASGVNIGQGGSDTSYIFVNPQYGFTGSVTLAVSGLPSGVTALWNPNPASGSSALTLTASSSASIGTTTLTITGKSGNLTATTTLSLAVYAPTFTLYGGGSLNIGQGSSGTSYVDVNAEYGFTGSVSFSISGLPSGVTAFFSPNPSTGFSNLTLTASSSAPIGNSTLTITGTSGNKTATTTLSLGIYAPTFTLSSQGSLSIGQGSFGTAYIYVNPQYGFTGSVNFAVSGLPGGVTASFSPNPSTGLSTLTLTASGSAPIGNSTLTITGTSGSLTASTTLSLGVYAPTFTLYGGGNLSVGLGNSVTSYIYVNGQYGFNGSVNLAISGLPSGVTASFSPNPATGSSLLTLAASSSASIGNSTLTITGTSGSLTATTTLTLGVYAPTFTISGPGSLSIGQGTSTTIYTSVNPQYGFAGSVNLSASGLPSGVTASFSPNPATGSSIMTLTVDSSTTVGQYTVTITGTSGGLTASTTFSLGIYAPSFTLYDSTYILSMNEGSTATSTVSVFPQYGFTSGVSLAASGLPSGVTATFSPNPATSSSLMTLTASNSVSPGIAAVTITGTSGSETATTPISLTINPPIFTLLDAPGEVNVIQGGSDISTISVISQYGFNDNVNLAVTGLPSGVTAVWSQNPATGSSVLTLSASNSATPGTSTLTITGTSGALVATTSLAVTVRTAPAITSTTLAVTSSGASVMSVTAGTVVTLTAAVSAGSIALTNGQMKFCDAETYCEDGHLLGRAQLTSAGTAVLKFIPGMGNHSYKAVFAGTNGDGTSSSSALALTVTASSASTTTIAQSGNAGNYTLTATVAGQGLLSPTGAVSFLDTSNGNFLLGTAALGQSETTLNWLNSQSPAAGTEPSSIAVGDFNGDGIPDLAVVNSNSNNLTILLGNGDGTFKANPVSPGTGSYPVSVAVGDFNSDGKTDLAVANTYDSTLTILLGNGDGTFTAAAASPQTGFSPESIAVGDFNGDGIPDLAVANGTSDTVTILLGNGDGTFTASPLSAQTGSEPKSIVVGDFNGDGIQDLAVASANSNTVTILLGNGDGTFTVGLSPQTGNGSESIAAGDFNGDGILDLAVADYSSSTVTILLGNGDGTFSTAIGSPSTGYSPDSIVVGDFNGDGKPDLAVANYFGNTVTVLLGNGDGTFTAGASPQTVNYAASIVAGDFNGDGVPDLAAANFYGNTVTVLTSQLTQKATATSGGISPVGYGSHLVEASYPGDSNYKSSVSGTTGLSASPGAPTISITPSSFDITTAQTLTVTVVVGGGSSNPIPTGLVTLTSGSYSAQQTLASGSATFNLAAGTLPLGSDALTATYTPDASSTGIYTTATQSLSVMVVGTAISTVTATPSVTTITNLQSVSVTISVAGGSGQATPTGTVTLSGGSYSAQAALSGGTASFTIAAGTLNNGTNTLTATYSGDGTYATANGLTAITVSQVVITAPTPSQVSPGGSATGTVTLTAGSTYSGTMNLTCTLAVSPIGAQSLPTCSLDPASVTLTAGGSGTTALKVNTTAASTGSLTSPSRLKFWGLGSGGALLAVSLIFGVPARRRRWLSMFVLLWVIAAAGAIGCGGSQGAPPSTPPSTPATTAGSYTFTLTGTDKANSNITTSATVTITVQ